MLIDYFVVVPLLTYLIVKGEFTPEEININAIGMFRAGVDTVSLPMRCYVKNSARI